MQTFIKTPPLFITRREVSSRLGVSDATVLRLEKKGIIHGIRVGGQSRYKWDDIISSLQTTTDERFKKEAVNG